MEKLLDQLVTPQSSFDAMQSESIGLNAASFKLPDTSTSLEESHNSSTTTSSNSSWMSESSCGCHSPRSSTYPPASSLVFHKRSILPPLLCSAARTEMQVYRTKALEKERKRRKQQKSHLLSRVEAILSSVNTDITTSLSSRESSPRSPNEENEEEADESLTCDGSPPDTKDEESAGASSSESCQESDHSDSDESVTSNHEGAYRRSLHNLLQKSLTLESKSHANNTSTLEKTSLNMKTQQVSTPSSGESGWADNTMATVIPNIPLRHKSESCRESSSPSEEDLDAAAERLVNTTLDSAKKGLMSQLLLSQRLNEDKGSVSNYPEEVANIDEENPLTSSTIDFPYFSPRVNKSTSPCKATEHINKALHLIEKNLVRSSPTDGNSHQIDSFSEDSQMVPVETVSSNNSSPDFFKETYPTSVLSSVTPETEALLVSYRKALEAEETQTTEADGLHAKANTPPESPITSGSQLTPSAFNHVQSEAIQQVTSHLSAIDEPLEEDSDISRSSQLGSRVRRNSYSLDAPSPFLISSRDAHTVYPLEDEGRQESLEEFSSDVKRKLEMPSDSEESSISTTRPSCHPTSLFQKGNATMSDYCRMLEEQHKKEMEELQLRHEAQLAKFKEELLRGRCHLSDSLVSSSVFEAVPAWQDDSLPQTHQPLMDMELHKKWCKFSALIKGHLTRMLLSTRPVQTTMQTIRDTSRTILSMRKEDTSVATSMSSIQDATLMSRLFSQLKAALYDLHTVFFETSAQERMEMISRSRSILAQARDAKVDGTSKHPRLSAATLKSLQRKKSERTSKEHGQKLSTSVNRSKRPVSSGHSQARQATSKISHIWKVDPLKKSVRETHKKVVRSPPSGDRKPKPLSPGGGKGQKNSKLFYPARRVLHRSMASNLTPVVR